MSLSERLSLPYLQPSQAQKHVTHNEALQRLDILVQLAAEEFDATTPPALPGDGAIYALGAAPTGDWAGHGDELAAWSGNSWVFIAPQAGWHALDKSSGVLKMRTDTGWDDLFSRDLNNLTGVGINTSHDSTNRLSVSAAATLLNHEGAGHQLKINKALAADTGSLLFQTGWSGRAEMGTTGSDDFAIKVSADGASWSTALSFDAGNATVSGAAVQQDPQDVAPGRLARADYAYCPGNLLNAVSQTGGVPDGGVIERGSNADGEYVRFADGTQICWVTGVNMGSIIAAGNGTWANPYRTNAVSLTWPVAFVQSPAATLSFGPNIQGGVPLEARGLVLNSYEPPEATGWEYIRVSRMGDSNFDVDVILSAMAVGRWF